MRSREIKNHVRLILHSKNFRERKNEFRRWRLRQVVNPLFSFLLSTEELIKWRSVTALGFVTALLAEKNMEAARVVVRRLIWQLNDESGGIGWGAPEAIGEIVSVQADLAREFGCYPVSFIRQDCNYLEYEPLQRGSVWAVGRVAKIRPEFAEGALPALLPFLVSQDSVVRGVAAWATGFVAKRKVPSPLEKLVEDKVKIPLYEDEVLVFRGIHEVAEEAIKRIRRS